VTHDDRVVPEAYLDLLPIASPEVQSRLDQGKTLELAGKSRGFNVMLLAAPKRGELTKLIVESKLVEWMGRDGG
jgi:hypothetical protein